MWGLFGAEAGVARVRVDHAACGVVVRVVLVGGEVVVVGVVVMVVRVVQVVE